MKRGEFAGMIVGERAATSELSVFRIHYDAGEVPSHSHEHARIALVLDGAGTEEASGRVDAIRKGHVVFWREGATHRDVVTRGTTMLQVELSHALYRHVASYFPPPPSPIDSDRFEGATQRLQQEMERFDGASSLALQAATYEILARATRLTATTRPLSFAVTQAMRFVTESLSEPITAADIAAAANVSMRRLHERFAEELRMTPMDYVRELRLARAESQLRETSQSATEIAEQCGFYDHAHFCRLFKQRTGDTPGRFRTKNAGMRS